MVNGIDELAVTNVDGLDSLELIRVCVGYRAGSDTFDYVPNDIELFVRCEPVYVDFPGWRETDQQSSPLEEPALARANLLEGTRELTGADLSIVSVGPAREQTIFL